MNIFFDFEFVEDERPRPVIREGCYICDDPEFALMGLPLCYPCAKCGGHVPADATTCDDCGHDSYEDYLEQLAKERG